MRRAAMVPALVLALVPAALVPAALAAQGKRSEHPLTIAYRVSAPDPSSHRFEVAMRVDGIRGETLTLQMPVWSPGRYARMDFARNVERFAVTDRGGDPVAFDLLNGGRWRLHVRHVKGVRVSYRVFADNLSGTFSVADTAHLNWNGASLFAYVVGHKRDPVKLTVVPPAGWHVINGASTAPDQTEFRFAAYDFLIDTPTEVAPAFQVDSFTVDGRLYRAVTHLNGGDDRGQRARFVQDVEKIVRYENRVLGPPPLTMYTFLFHLGYAGGDGMEHLVSTQIINAKLWTDSATVLPGVGTASHEYFHVWNVKRIRPAALGPFDYEDAVFQPSLWVAEGWTNYYGNIGLLRAGIEPRQLYYEELAGLIEYNLERPAAKWVSARMASTIAPYWDGASPPMRTDADDAFISYYQKGEALALVLDLEIRARTGGKRSLDDVLRALKRRTWDAPGHSYYLPGRGYTEADVEKSASEAAGTDMHAWFARYAGGTAEVPFAAALARVGVKYTVRGEGTARRYEIEEDSTATAAQLALREQWLSGTTAEEGSR